MEGDLGCLCLDFIDNREMEGRVLWTQVAEGERDEGDGLWVILGGG